MRLAILIPSASRMKMFRWYFATKHDLTATAIRPEY